MVDGSVHDRQFGCKVQKAKACVAPIELEWRSLPRERASHSTADEDIALYAPCDQLVDLPNAHICAYQMVIFSVCLCWLFSPFLVKRISKSR